MKNLFLLIAVCIATVAQAQDVIVKRDGSTIISKVLEVNQADIKYKKFSNQQGPTYTINKSEVMAINYESGDKDTFEDAPQPAASVQAPANPSTPFGVNPNLAEDNLKLVREFNKGSLDYIGDKKAKDCYYYIGVLKIREGSIIETPELAMDFAISNTLEACSYNAELTVTLKNKTDRVIYVDLANCFFTEGGKSRPYYSPAMTTIGHGGTNGANVNLGAITNSVGIGGALGTLANGINVGSSTSNISTTTTFAQRVVAIPPMASISLNPQNICTVSEKFGTYGKNCKVASSTLLRHIPYLMQMGVVKDSPNYYKMSRGMLKRGEVLELPSDKDDDISIHITYSYEENSTNKQSIRSGLNMVQIIGDPEDYCYSLSLSCFAEISIPRLFFRIWGGKLLKK